MRQCQEADHRAAGFLLAAGGQQHLEGAPISAAREELLAVDEIEQRHRLAPQGMDNVPIIDDMTVLAVGPRAAAAQCHQRRRAEEAFEPVVIEPHAQPMPDQARGNRVEHLPERKAAARGDRDDRLLVIGRAARRQRLQRRAFEIKALCQPGVAAPDDLGDKTA